MAARIEAIKYHSAEGIYTVWRYGSQAGECYTEADLRSGYIKRSVIRKCAIAKQNPDLCIYKFKEACS